MEHLLNDMFKPAEETQDASVTLPKAIMWSVYLNCFMGLIMAVTICFTLGDVTSILASTTGYPFIQIFYNTTNSFAATNLLTAIIIITLTSSCISEVATASRQIWSFARDRGLPFSNFLAHASLPIKNSSSATLKSLSGQSWLKHPHPRSPRLSRPNHYPCVHQHRLLYRPERNRVPVRRRPAIFVLHHHRLRCSEEVQGRAPPATAVVARTLRHGHQRGGAALPSPDLVFRFLAYGKSCAGEYYELGTGYVCWYYRYLNVLLLFQRPVSIRWANWANKDGCTRFVKDLLSGVDGNISNMKISLYL